MVNMMWLFLQEVKIRHVSYFEKQVRHDPLTVTWAPHSYTEIAGKILFHGLNLDMTTSNTPDRSVHKKLTSLSFKNLLHPFQPFIIGQICCPGC